MSTMEPPPSWILLLYALPTKRSSERVNLWRKLKKCGAVQLKSSAYILPDSPTHFERFQWLAKQVRDSKGDATLIRLTEVDGLSGEQIADLFRAARTIDYDALRREMIALGQRRKAVDAERVDNLRLRLQEIQEIDFFQSPAAHDVELALRQLDNRTHVTNKTCSQVDRRSFLKRTWLTRPRPEIDRVGSAWLIRRFIDPDARFVFAGSPRKFPDAVPYDMLDVEFTHQGEDCTFETLIKRFGLEDTALLALAEMVHDADLEDGKFRRSECVGIDRVLKGWARLGLSDEEVLAKGSECFDALYESLRK